MTSTQRPLFARFPSLEEKLAPLALCTLPTRVHTLPSVGAHAWVKRDDETYPEYGGNKMRKLEFVGAEMKRAHTKRAILFGATGTNAGVAASLVCRDLGIHLDVLTFPQPPSKTVSRNAALMKHYGAHLSPHGSLPRTVAAWQLHPRRLTSSTTFLYAGCSNPVATFAYVNAALELAAQIEAGECPRFSTVVVAAGSGATLAGLALGCALAGLDTRVVGVRVAPRSVGPFAACAPSVVDKMMKRCANDLARMTGSGSVGLPAYEFDEDRYGGGYGVATSGALEAIDVFAACGIALEQTYTGKAAAAFLARARASSSPILFWNTFSSRPDPPGFVA